MIKCLKDIGLNGKDIRLIVNLYWTQKAYIQLEQDLSGEIMIKREYVKDVCCLHVSLISTQKLKIWKV